MKNDNWIQKPWMKYTLYLAGIYNIIFGIWVIVFPFALFDFAGMQRPLYPQIWQCVGMIVGVYGLGYIISARDVIKHWPIILVGFLGKIFGPIGFAGNLITGDFPLRFGVVIITNDLIWWVPFLMILIFVKRAYQNEKYI